jgi:hypothetical protein
MTVVDTLKQLITGASSAIQGLQRGVTAIREELDELAREERALLSQPAAPAVVEPGVGWHGG